MTRRRGKLSIIGTWLAVTLCANAMAQDAPQVELLAKGTASWDGTELPAYSNGKPEVTVIKVTIPPHGTIALNKHPVINAGYLLSGSLAVVTEEADTLRMNPGDALIEVVNEWHSGMNSGDVPAEILVFYAGTTEQPISVSPPGTLEP